MVAGTVLCWCAWAIVVGNIDPTTSGLLGILFFYFSLFLALIGTVSIVNLLFHKIVIKQTEVVLQKIKMIFRQSIIFSILVIICLEFLHQGWLRWWSALILLLLGLTIEGMIFTKKKWQSVTV
jgi:hypothetical protein